MSDPTVPESGPEAAASAKSAGRPGLDVSEEEVDALLAERAAGGRPDVPRPYNLVAGAAARYRAPVLDGIHERWIGVLAQRLGALARQELELTLGDVKLMPYADWQAALPVP